MMTELQKTQALLCQFLNENTPSSKLPQRKYPNRIKKESKPRGKPKGRNGATKEEPDRIDERVKAKLGKTCLKCGRKIPKSEVCKQIRHIYDIIIQSKITEVEEEYFFCDCGELCKGKHPEIPENGMIGYNLQAFIEELKFNFAGSCGKISTFLENIANIKFTSMTINNCINRVAEKLTPSYEDMKDNMPNASYSYTDETGWPVEGKRGMLWIFITNFGTLIHIRNSRGRRVLEDIFTEDYFGVIISDCFKVYRCFAKHFQKCWVHFLRKLEFEGEKDENVRQLYEQMLDFYKEIKDFLSENPPYDIRKKKKLYFERKLKRIMNYKGWNAKSKEIIKNWLIEYKGHWLTAIEIEGINLDNNISERGIRKVIPWRKILGGHRTKEGAYNFAVIESHRQTWKMQEKSPYLEMISHLKQ
jgi:transposase